MRTLFTVKRLLNIEAGAIISDGYVAVDGGVIQSLGRRADLPESVPDAVELRFSDHTLLPGLINSHVHLCCASGGKPFYHRQSDAMALLNAVRNARLELLSGVTSVRDCGDQRGVLFEFREAVSHGIADAPRLLLCGPPITMTRGHAHFLGGEADGPDDMRRAVRDRAGRGADFIKVIATGGGTPGSDPSRATYTIPELSAAVEAARILGKPVSAHCRGIPGIESALDAGISHLEHACFERPDGTLRYDPDLGSRIADQGVSVTPTIQLYRDALDHLTKKREPFGLTSEESRRIALLPGQISAKYQALCEMIGRGVRCVAGNDAGLPFTGFGEFWKELDAMVAAGLTPIQAIQAATCLPAAVFGLSETLGSIRAGKQADLLIVAGDPTARIADLSRVALVMAGGRIIRHEGAKPDPGPEGN